MSAEIGHCDIKRFARIRWPLEVTDSMRQVATPVFHIPAITVLVGREDALVWITIKINTLAALCPNFALIPAQPHIAGNRRRCDGFKKLLSQLKPGTE
jgi:hypothetical protein